MHVSYASALGPFGSSAFLFVSVLSKWMRQMSLPAIRPRINRRLMLLKKTVIKTTMRRTPPVRRTMDRASSFRNLIKTWPLSEGKTLTCSSKRFRWLPSLLATPEIKDKTLEFVTPRPQPGRLMPRSLLRCPGRLQTEPRQPSRGKWRVRAWCRRLLCFRHVRWFLTLSGNSKAREEHSRNEAQDHRERLVITELGDTYGFDAEPPEFPHSPERCRVPQLGHSASSFSN